MARLILCLAIVLSIVTSISAAPRTWSDNTGRFKIEAELVSVSDGKVKLKRADGRVVELTAARLSAADQRFLKSAEADSRRVASAALRMAQGIWKVTACRKDVIHYAGSRGWGWDGGLNAIGEIHFQITGNSFVIGNLWKEEFSVLSDRSRFTLDVSKTPTEIDVTVFGSTYLGTCSVTPDTIEIRSLASDAHNRRVDSAPTGGKRKDSQLFIELTRVKSKVKVIQPDVEPIVTETKRYDASLTKPLWDKYESARALTFHPPWRKASQWALVDQRRALYDIIEKCPNSLDEARARLELIRRLHESSTGIPHQAFLARRLLRGLMRNESASSELTRAVSVAAFQARNDVVLFVVYGPSRYRDDAMAYLEKRWNAGASDAPLAGYFRAWLTVNQSTSTGRNLQTPVQLDRYREVATRFPETIWGQYCAYRVLCEHHGSLLEKRHDKFYKPFETLSKQPTGIEELRAQFAAARLAFAEQHAKSPMAALAMSSVAHSYLNGPFRPAPDEQALPRITKGFEVYAKLAKQFPDEVDLSWHPHELRIVYSDGLHVEAENTLAPDTRELETLVKQFFAWHPDGNPYWILRKICFAKFGDNRAKGVAYRDHYWADVEKLAANNKKAAVAAWYAYRISRRSSRDVPPKLYENALSRVIAEYPDSPYAATALDALARHAWRPKTPERSFELWERLLNRYPKHPLCRPVALDLAYLRHADGDPKQWRRALTQLEERFPNDPMFDVLCPYLRAKSFLQEGKHVDAWREKQLAAPHRRAVFSSDAESLYAARNENMTEYKRIRSTLKACLADARKMNNRPRLNAVGPLAKYEGRDVQFLADLGKTDGELLQGRLAFVKQFPDSPQVSPLLFQVGLQYERMKKFDEAHQTYVKIDEVGKPRAEQRLVASVARLRLDYEQLGDAPKKLTAKQAADEVRRLLARYMTQSVSEVQSDAEQRAAVEVYQAAWQRSAPGTFGKLIASRKTDRWTFVSPSKKLGVQFWTGDYVVGELRIDLPDIPRVAIMPQSLHPALGIEHSDKSTTLSKFAKDVVPTVFVTDKKGLPVTTAVFTRFLRMKMLDEKQTHCRVYFRSKSDTGPWSSDWQKEGDRWVREIRIR
jgi:hypothetical protein